jgi:uncharacterized membrane protein YdfJ with MMPL/SSD domain
VVRSMLVPAIITLVGDRSWWPSRLAKDAPAAETATEAPRPKETV